MKRIRVLTAWLMAALLLLSLGAVCASALTAQPLIMGDPDRNGSLDTRDVRAVLMQIVGKRPLEATRLKQVDLNGDGRVDTLDARELLRWIAEGAAETAPTMTTTTAATTTTATTTTTRPSFDDEGFYDDVVKP